MTIRVKDGRSFRQACDDNGINFWQAYDKIRMHRMSPDEAIKYVKEHKPKYMCRGKTLRQYCIENGVPYNRVVDYHNLGAKESFEEIIDKKLYRKNVYTDFQFCKDHNINYWNAKMRHNYAVIRKDCNKSFKDFCKDIYHLSPSGIVTANS